MMTQNPVK